MALVDWSDPAAESVLRLVCGLPQDKMATRRLMAFQAFIDDSTQSGTVTVLAGYMAEAAAWVDFSKEWSELLSMRPPWAIFKSKELMYEPSEITLERIVAHYRTIEKYARIGVCVAIPHEPFYRLMKEYNCPKEWSNPYFMAYILLLSVLQHYIRPTLGNDTVDMIFDYQTESRRALDAWHALTQGGKVNIELVRNPPIFRSDTEFMPLQAADLLAWHVRKQFASTCSVNNMENMFRWPIKSRRPFYVCALADEYVMRKQILKALGIEFAPTYFVAGRSFP